MAYFSPNPLVNRRQAALDAAKLLESKAKAEHRDLTDDELSQVECLMATVDELRDRIDAENGVRQKEQEARKKLAAADAWGSQPQPGQQVRQTNPQHLSGPGSPGWGENSATSRSRGRGRSYSALFGPPAGSDGWASLGEFLGCVHRSLFDSRLQASNIGGEGASGGFAVPEIYAGYFIDHMLQESVFLRLADVVPMESDKKHYWGFDGTNRTSHLFGGVSATWAPELTQPDTSTPKLLKITLACNKLFLLCQASNELLADSRDFENRLASTMAAAAAWYIDDVCVSGTGSGQPLGILNAPSLLTQAADDGQTAGTLTYGNLAGMMGSLHPASFKSAVWLVHPSCTAQLLKLTIPVEDAEGNIVGGSHYPALVESSGEYRLLGRPCYFMEQLSTLGTAGDLLLVDPRQFAVGMRKGLAVERSAHAGFADDSTWFRLTCRLDGQPKWGSIVTLHDGTQVSWAVALATRD